MGTYMESAFDLYKFLKDNNNLIAANMLYPWAPGHMISELDNLLRMIRVGDVPPNVACLVPVAENPITATIAEIYAPLLNELRIVYVPNNAIYLWSREIARACPDMVVDVGLSHVKYALKTMEENRLSMYQGLLHHVITNQGVVRDNVAWAKRRSQSMDYRPLSRLPEMGDDLRRFLGDRCEKIAVIHSRSVIANAGVTSPPEQFYSSLGFLRDTGHTIVFVSREPYVEEFNRFGVLNYAESPVASFRNDLHLF